MKNIIYISIALLIGFTNIFAQSAPKTSGAGNFTADSIEWQSLLLDEGPESRMGTAMAMFEHTSELILFGGNANSTVFNDTWAWDGKKWKEKKTAFTPPALNGHAMAYDPVRKQIVMFGGFDSGKMSNSTYIYNGKDWKKAESQKHPQYAINPAMAFNYATGKVMLYGGIQNDPSIWEWDGKEWSQIKPESGPPPRSYAGLAYDQNKKEMIMFGGITNPSAPEPLIYNDTWAWNGSTWRKIETAVSPSSRYYHTMAYHPLLKKIILVGGRKGKRDKGPGPDGIFKDTWSWDGSKWLQHTSENGIQPAYSYGMGFSKRNRKFYVYLGDSLLCATRGPKVFVLRNK